MTKKKKNAADGIHPPDGLEIVSIGSLYTDKKYWSSSRGKDRYPYPVGYHAVRTHADQSYRMEIRQGANAPLFVVTCADGDCYSGHTPDMAWESFQKKNGPKVKNWHGRRLSSNVDGVELFGFKNPSVQRLLRELVASVNETSERGSLPPDFHRGISRLVSEVPKQDEVPKQELCVDPNLVSVSKKPNCLWKRARKKRVSCTINAMIPDKPLSIGLPESHISSSKRGNAFHAASEKKVLPKTEISDAAENQLLLHPSSEVGDGINLNDDMPCQHNQDNQNNIKAVMKLSTGCLENSSESILHESKTADIGIYNCPLGGTASPKTKHSTPFAEDSLEKIDDSPQVNLMMFPNAAGKTANNLQFSSSPVAIHASWRQSIHQTFSGSPDAHSVGIHPAITGNGDEGILTLKRVELRDNTYLCVPDTIDGTQDNFEASKSERGMHVGRMDAVIDFKTKGPCPLGAEGIEVEPSVGYELPLIGHVVTSDKEDKNDQVTPVLVESECIIPPQHGVSISCGSSNSSSERMDLDSAGQELAKSMMTFLLPRAVPLLKKTYLRKRKRAKAQKEHKSYANDKHANHLSSGGKHSPYIAPDLIDDKLHGEGLHLNMEGKMYIRESPSKSRLALNPDGVVHPSASTNAKFKEIEYLDDNKAVIPDSFDDELFDSYAAKFFPSYFGTVGADQSHSDNLNSEDKTYAAYCGVCEEGSNNDNDGCCKDNDSPEAIKGGSTFDSPSLVMHSTLEHLNSCSLGKSFMGKDEDASHVRLSVVPNDMHTGKSYEISNNVLSSEQQDHHGCRFRSNSAGLPEESHLVHDETETAVQSNIDGQNGVDISNENASAVGSSICNENVKTNDGDQDSHQVSHASREIGKLHTSKLQALEELNSTNSKEHMLPCYFYNVRKEAVPLSESIICRNIRADDIPTEGIVVESTQVAKISSPFTTSVTKSPLHTKIPSCVSENELLVVAASSKLVSENELASDLAIDCRYIRNITNSTNPTVVQVDSSTVAICGQGDSGKTYLQDCSKIPSEYISYDIPAAAPFCEQHTSVESVSSINKVQSCIRICKESVANHYSSLDAELCKEYNTCLEPLGFYVHPEPVLSILVDVKGGEVVLGVLSGHTENNKRDIIIYKIASEQTAVHPSFSGYASILLPTQDGLFNENAKVSFERSCIQFSSDAQFLFLHSSMKVPSCRERSFDCLCSSCESGFCKENGIKIVRVNFGYVSNVKNLKTAARVCCLLVCESDYVIAAEETGMLHGWRMDSNWRETLEDFILPCSDDAPHLILELKRLPCQSSIIIGHNAEGSFALWDIRNRVLLGRFSSPGSQICQIHPVGLCSLVNDVALNSLRMTELNLESNRGKEARFHDYGEYYPLPHVDGESFAVWLLVLASSGSRIPHDLMMQEPRLKPVDWRLALLVKDMVILGSILDPRACIVESVPGIGIVGTRDGFLYMWELSTGRKIMNLNPFSGGKISCIAAAPTSSALAVADDENRIVVYVPRAAICPLNKEFYHP